MKATTPAKLIPPDQSTAASGTLPTEQTKVRIAISGPTRTFSIVRTQRRRVGDEEDVEEVVAEQADEAGEQEAEGDLLPEHRPVAAEVGGDLGPGVGRGAGARASRRVGPRGRGGGRARPGRRWACARASCLEPGETKRRSSIAISAIRMKPPTYSASANCQPSRTQRTSPSSQTRLVEANWKASAVTAEAPFWNSDLAIAIAA